AFFSRVLIAKKSQEAASLEHLVCLSRAGALGEQPLAHLLPKSCNQTIEKGIVEGAYDGVGADAPKVADVTEGLEISKMARDADFRAKNTDRFYPFAFIRIRDILSPVRLMNLAAQVGDFADHQQQVAPHLLGDFVPLAVRLFREGEPQIFLDNSATDFGYVARKECQPAADEITRLNPHRLYQRYRNANGEILGEMTNLAEHKRSAKTQLFGSQMTNPGW